MNGFWHSIRFKTILSYMLLVSFVLVLSFVLIQQTVEKVMINDLKSNVSRSGEAFIRRVKPLLTFDLRILNNVTEEFVERNVDTPKMRYIIISKNGYVRFDSFKEFTGDELAYLPEVRSALAGKRVNNYIRTSCQANEIYYASPIYDDTTLQGCLFISASTAGVEKQLRSFARSYIFISIFCLSFAVIGAFAFSVSIVSPITELSKSVLLSEKNIKHNKLALYDNDEITILRRHHNIFASHNTIAEDLVNKFISNVSHELKTPIASIKVLSEPLIETPSDDVSIYQDFFNDINKEMDHLDNIIDNLIDLVYMQDRDYTLETEAFDVMVITRNRVLSLMSLAEKKGLKMKFEGDESIVTCVDKTKYIQVVDNLISNAIKYTGEGGHVVVRVLRRGNYFILEVEDDGIGISELDQFMIFNRFYMADYSRQRSKGSSGLGLSIVRQIVSLHSGTIEVKSDINKGSLFIVSIPIVKE